MNTSEINIDKKEKDKFSKNATDDHNFQTASMENKLKNIKKKKKAKMKNNFKNIEALSVLENEHFGLVEGDNDEMKKKPIDVDNVENFDNLNSIFTNKIIEGNTNLDDKNNKDNWEGHDEVSEKEKDKIEWKKGAVQFVESSYESVVSYSRIFADRIAYVLSDGTYSEDDKIIIRDYFATIFASIISVPITFNWYYLIYYVPRNNVFSMKLSDLKEMASNLNMDSLKFILFIFEFALFFPFQLNNFLMDVVPFYTTNIISNKLKFIIIYFCSFYGVKVITRKIKDLCLDLISDATSNMLINFMFAIVFINFFISLFSLTYEELFTFNPIIYGAKNFVRFIIIIIISVFVAIMLCLLYLFTYSLFGIVLYSKEEISETIMNILSHSNHDFDYGNKTCDEEGILKRLFRYIMKIIGLFKENIFIVILVFVVVFYTLKFNRELSDTDGIINGVSFKDSFMFFNFLFFVIIITWLYIGVSDMLKDATNNSEK